MKIGISSPVVIRHPATRRAWEDDATIEDLARIAEAADELGYHHLTCSEHVAVPTPTARERGGTYWDPLATFGFLAARTRRILLATQVLVLGYHHPLEIAKRYGTLDTVSGGRLVLGVGVGSLEAEFDLLGAQFAGRGAIADDAMRALRAALGEELPEYHGTHYDFGDVVVSPHAVQPRVPMWVGGKSLRSLRRACALGDGWVPFGLPHHALAGMLAQVEPPEGFAVVLPAGAQLDPGADPDGCRRALDATRDAGATIASVSVAATGADHYRDQLAGLAELAGSAGVEFG